MRRTVLAANFREESRDTRRFAADVAMVPLDDMPGDYTQRCVIRHVRFLRAIARVQQSDGSLERHIRRRASRAERTLSAAAIVDPECLENARCRGILDGDFAHSKFRSGSHHYLPLPTGAIWLPEMYLDQIYKYRDQIH